MNNERLAELKRKFGRRLRGQDHQFHINRASADGLRWIENISKGFRLAGYADDLASLRHKGW